MNNFKRDLIVMTISATLVGFILGLASGIGFGVSRCESILEETQRR